MEEKILIEGLCNRVKGAFVENGHAVLTNKRFIYSKHSLTKIAAMGVLVNLTKGDFDFDMFLVVYVHIPHHNLNFFFVIFIIIFIAFQ